MKDYFATRGNNYIILFIVASMAMLIGCEKEEPVLKLATVTTTAVSSIGSTFAISGGEVLNDGGVTITDAGVVWSTEPNPTIELSTKIKSNSLKGSYTSNIAPLSILTKYYVRAYATNSVGTSYGNEIDFTTSNKSPCLISMYTLRQSNINQTFQIVYDANKRIDIFGIDPQYKYKYSGDSIYINNYLGGTLYDLSFTSQSSNGIVQSIKKYFSSTGGIYRYSFDYSVANQISITLDYSSIYAVDKNTPPTKVVRGEYKTDNSGNVTQLNVYLPNTNGDWVIDKTSTYKYDKSENPVRGLIIPFFDYQWIPEVYYLSSSNMLAKTTGTTTINYSYQYAPNGLPISSTIVNSSQPAMKFTYISCPF